ncbi:uncharacterized protein LOC123675349 [Harmonia axyridis]|uniref:uncharacterized protein LOC123675349 n=1 Tax=Harmonia axyridis TaxID=115357 RepID=UPI001E276905|nr:uncharacterized protein LOC123675349 [Harmonia axyridis]
MDVAIPADDNLSKTFIEKLTKYHDLAFELKTIYNLKSTTILPLLMSRNGLVEKHLVENTQRLELDEEVISAAQKEVILANTRLGNCKIQQNTSSTIKQKTEYNNLLNARLISKSKKCTKVDRKIKALQRRIHKADYKVPEKWFKNLSQTTVPEEVKTVLGLGSKFNVPLDHKEIHIKDLIADVESILDLVEEDRRDTLRAKIASIITGHLHKVLDSDKGSVTVLMDRADYLQKMYSIVDTDDFKNISRDPTTTIQNKTNKIISTLVNQNILSKEAARSMKSYNSVSPRMYGNPKIHKENVPMRPIVSDVQGPTCKFSNYIAQILTEAYDQDNAYYELVLRAMEFHWNKIEAFCNISKEYFKEMITFLLESGYFMFDGSFYLQMFGCIMGSRLSPILSLYVMDYVLDSCISRLTFTLAFIKKYVDDLIISLPSTGTEEILQVFNSFDPKLKLIETEDCYNSVPFLDTKNKKTGFIKSVIQHSEMEA